MNSPQHESPKLMSAADTQDFFMNMLNPVGGDARLSQADLSNKYSPPAAELSAAPTAPRQNASFRME